MGFQLHDERRHEITPEHQHEDGEEEEGEEPGQRGDDAADCGEERVHRADRSGAISGKLKNAEYTKDSTFGLSIPVEIEDVPKTILNPINAWSDKEKYKAQAEDLIQRFEKNFEKFGEKVEHIAEKGSFNK